MSAFSRGPCVIALHRLTTHRVNNNINKILSVAALIPCRLIHYLTHKHPTEKRMIWTRYKGKSKRIVSAPRWYDDGDNDAYDHLPSSFILKLDSANASYGSFLRPRQSNRVVTRKETIPYRTLFHPALPSFEMVCCCCICFDDDSPVSDSFSRSVWYRLDATINSTLLLSS